MSQDPDRFRREREPSLPGRAEDERLDEERSVEDVAAGARVDDENEESEWDANDERRQRDPMAPPAEPCECYCLHCRRTFMSDRIWFQRIINDPDGTLAGFWMCPTPNCGGAGFTFDIYPTDPTHPANAGWHYCDDDEDDDDDEEEEDFFSDDDDDDDEVLSAEDDSAAGEWDPDEAKYREMDEVLGDGPVFDEDYAGEEWKYGLEPGERPEPPGLAEMRREREAEEERYDEPDERPRELDWSDRPRRRPPGDGEFLEDDIPF